MYVERDSSIPDVMVIPAVYSRSAPQGAAIWCRLPKLGGLHDLRGAACLVVVPAGSTASTPRLRIIVPLTTTPSMPDASEISRSAQREVVYAAQLAAPIVAGSKITGSAGAPSARRPRSTRPNTSAGRDVSMRTLSRLNAPFSPHPMPEKMGQARVAELAGMRTGIDSPTTVHELFSNGSTSLSLVVGHRHAEARFESGTQRHVERQISVGRTSRSRAMSKKQALLQLRLWRVLADHRLGEGGAERTGGPFVSIRSAKARRNSGSA